MSIDVVKSNNNKKQGKENKTKNNLYIEHWTHVELRLSLFWNKLTKLNDVKFDSWPRAASVERMHTYTYKCIYK